MFGLFSPDKAPFSLIITPRDLKRLTGIKTENIPGSSVAGDCLKLKSFINQRIKLERSESNWIFAIVSAFFLTASYLAIILTNKLFTSGTFFTYSRAIVTSGTIAVAVFIVCNLILALSLRSQIKSNSKNRRFSTLRALIDDINSYNQAARTLNDQIKITNLSEQSNRINQQRKIQVFQKVKQQLITALKTERIIRENPNFDPDAVASNIVPVSAISLNQTASSYSQELADAIAIGIKVEKEITNRSQNLNLRE